MVVFVDDSNSPADNGPCCSPGNISARSSNFSDRSKGSLAARMSNYSVFSRAGSLASQRKAIFGHRNLDDERTRLARLDTDEFVVESNTKTQGIHELHRRLSPVMWGVSLEDLKLFHAEVLNTLQLGLIENYEATHADYNPHHWDESIGPNMYQVNKCYIKPVTWRAGGMSFALMLNASGLKSDVFATHCWCEGIFEFVDKCRSSWPRNARSLWCCFLANPQNSNINELLSGSVFESPFAQALRQVSYMIVLPNHQCSIYTRLWCVLEANLAIEYDIEIILRERVSRQAKIMVSATTIFGGLLVCTYVWMVCSGMRWASASSKGDALRGVTVFAPALGAAGFRWWSQGRYLRLEIHARLVIFACISSFLFYLLYNFDDIWKVVDTSASNSDQSDNCIFKDTLDLCSDTVVLANLAFIGIIIASKRASHRERDDDDDSEEDCSNMEIEGDAHDNQDSQWRLRGTCFLYVEIICEVLFAAWFVLELLIRIVASYIVCPMLSVTTLVMELIFNTIAVVDIATTCNAQRGSPGTCCKRGVTCFSGCATLAAVMAFVGKFTPNIDRIKKIRRLMRLLKFLRLSRLIRFLAIPHAWWLCWCMIATVLHSGFVTALESILAEELRATSAQLAFSSVRDATCSHPDDSVRLFEAIKGKEDEIDTAIHVFRTAGKYDHDVRELLSLGLDVSRKTTKYDWPGLLHMTIVWTAFCLATMVRWRDPFWWIAPFYSIVSCGLTICFRPRACRLNFAVTCWRRPVWGAFLLGMIYKFSGLPREAFCFVRYCIRFWGIAVAAMGPRTAYDIYSGLWRCPTQYGCIQALMSFCIATCVVISITYDLVLHFQYVACVETAVGGKQIPRNHTAYVGDELYNLHKDCYIHWALYYHTFLVVFGVLWTFCGIAYEYRVRSSKVSMFAEINDTKVAVKSPHKSNETGNDDRTTRAQWIELAEQTQKSETLLSQ